MNRNDPKVYREMCLPKTVEQANADWTAFAGELYELRVKHRIADVYVIARMPIQYDDGDEAPQNVSAHFGDVLNREPMTAWAVGFESANRQAMIREVIADAAKKAPLKAAR
jgi:hypothetical protein